MNNFLKFIMNYTPAIAITALLVGVSAFGLAISNPQDEMFGAVLTSNMTGSTSLAVLNAKFDALDALDATIPGDTDDLDEGSSNLYWTTARGDARIYALVSASTSLPNLDITESQISDFGTYFDNISDFTGTLTDSKYCIYTTGTGIVCNSEGGGSSFSSIADINSALSGETVASTTIVDGYFNGLDDMALAQGNIYVGDGSNNPKATSTIYITDDGRVIVGKTGATSVPDTNGNGFVLLSESGFYSDFGNYNYDDAGSPAFFLGNADGSYASPGALDDNDTIGTLYFKGYDGSDFDYVSAEIEVKVDGTVSANNVPAEMLFKTDGETSLTISPTGLLTYSYASTTGITADNFWGTFIGNLTGTASGNLVSADIAAYMQDEDINTISELNSWVTDATLLVSGGTLTNGYVCRADGTGGAVDCNLVTDGSGACSAGAVCTGGHTHVGVNETYGSGWNGDTATPEKDDIYDYLHLFDADDDGSFTDELWFSAGGEASYATTSYDFIIHKAGSTYYSYEPATGITDSNASFSVLLQDRVDDLDDDAGGGSIFINPGVYYATATTTITGRGSTQDYYLEKVAIRGETGATKIIAVGNISVLHLTDWAVADISGLSFYLTGTASGISSNGVDAGNRAFWLSNFSDLYFTSTTTHTGYAVDMGNPFRSKFDNIEFLEVGNCYRFTAEDTTANYGAFNPGDFTISRSFCDLNGQGSAGLTFAAAGNYGRINQVSIDVLEIYGEDDGDTGVIFGGQATLNTLDNINTENVYTGFSFPSGSVMGASRNRVNTNYVYIRDGGTLFSFGDNSVGNQIKIGEIYNGDTVTLWNDANTNSSQPNHLVQAVINNDGTLSITNPTTITSVIENISGRQDGTVNSTNLFNFFNQIVKGFLGVGTTTPAYPLDVYGDARVDGTVIVQGALEIPNGTNPSAGDPGELAHDTTDNQLILDDYVIRTHEKIGSVCVASSSLEFVSGGILPVPREIDGYTISNMSCYVDGGTSVVLNLSDGTNDTDSLTCDADGAVDDGSIANATVTAGELMRLEFGTVTGAVDYVCFSWFGTITRE